MHRFNRRLLLALSIAVSASTADAQLTQVFSQVALNGPLTVHDFESGPSGLGANYSFASGSPLTRAACATAGCVTPSGLNGLSSTLFPDILTITFINPVGSIGMFFGNDDTCCSRGFSAFLDVFDGAGLLGTVSVAANMNDAADQYLGLNSTTGITYAQVRYGSGSDVGLFTYLDDVAFGAATTTVPEPGTVGLVAMGLLAVVGVAKRRKHSTKA